MWTGFFVYKDRNWFKNTNPALASDAESREEIAWRSMGLSCSASLRLQNCRFAFISTLERENVPRQFAGL